MLAVRVKMHHGVRAMPQREIHSRLQRGPLPQIERMAQAMAFKTFKLLNGRNIRSIIHNNRFVAAGKDGGDDIPQSRPLIETGSHYIHPARHSASQNLFSILH